mmetsp:Transcript_3880/g.5525  ORF Transcript_3880/g.5525 Transcript_3880/m.5525 type:complete len:89 (+) Transcript_3880:30-296(+)
MAMPRRSAVLRYHIFHGLLKDVQNTSGVMLIIAFLSSCLLGNHVQPGLQYARITRPHVGHSVVDHQVTTACLTSLQLRRIPAAFLHGP